MLAYLIVFLPMAGAVLAALCGSGRPARFLAGRSAAYLRDRSVIAVTALVFVLSCLTIPLLPSASAAGFLVSGFSFVTDGFRSVYAIVTAYMWLFTAVFSLEYFRDEEEHLTRYYFFMLVTLGATEGVMLSGDLMTSFIFFELLSFTSFTWVIHEETEDAIRAGYTYLFIAVIGGLVLFMGLLLLKNACGTLSFRELPDALLHGRTAVRAAAICILIGFGAKAGMYPLHIWLPKAHPVAPSPASALLSGILTKVGIYGILMTTLTVLPDDTVYGEIVLLLGVVTMFLGALLALFSVNLKRTLACSSMSQVGFILTGTGMYVLLRAAGSGEGSSLALSGTMLHMLNHSTIKLTLFMAAGVVAMNLHTLTLDDIRGYGRKKPFLKAAFALGALGISGVPLFSGFISKTLLHEIIVHGAHEAVEIPRGLTAISPACLTAVEWIFLISGGLTFAYMLKLFICIFVEENRDPRRQAMFDADTADAAPGQVSRASAHAPYMNTASTAVIFGSSLLMAVLGQPFLMKRIAAWMTGNDEILAFRAFTFENIKGGFISLLIGGLVYMIIVRRALVRDGSYVNLWPAWLDLENLIYRPLAKAAVFLGTLFGRILAVSTDALLLLLRKTVVRERSVRRAENLRRVPFVVTLREATAEAISPLLENFSFALMMTCVGILIILGALIWMLA